MFGRVVDVVVSALATPVSDRRRAAGRIKEMEDLMMG
jgi:hypothetical protein